MPIRLRLAAWCVAIFCALLAPLAVVIYEIHTQAHYHDLDQTLAAVTTHFQSEIERALATGSTLNSALLATVELRGAELVGADVAVYDRAGRPVEGRPLPGAVLAPGGTAPDNHGTATFQTIATPAARMRLHTMPLVVDGATAGYVQSRVSLAALDAAIARFRLVLLAAVVGGLAVAAVGSLITATRALRPIADVTELARAIALSRGFGRRLEPIRQDDELGELVHTFNEMLGSLDAAYQAQRRFVDDAAHELRAPVTSITGNLDLLERAHDLPAADRAAALADVRAEAERLGRLVNDLLSLARADAGQRMIRRSVDLDRIVVDGVRTMRRLAGDVDLRITTLEPAMVAGDPDRLKQVLVILLENALHYTPAGGRVRVSLRRQAEQATLAVEDTGIGIAAADLSHIFDRFYRADPARSRVAGGSGLGLAIAKWIVEAHDGGIEVESEPDHGTIVRLWLPLADARPATRGAHDVTAG